MGIRVLTQRFPSDQAAEEYANGATISSQPARDNGGGDNGVDNGL